MKTRSTTLLAIIVLANVAVAQQPPPTQDQLVESKLATLYFNQHNIIAALPLYEHLAQEFPQNIIIAERLAECLYGSTAGMPPGPARQAIMDRVATEIKRAQSLGSKSALLVTISEFLAKPPTSEGPVTPLTEMMKAAEVAFSKGDLDTALKNYEAAATMDPTYYVAALFAGDIYFRKRDAEQAGKWFAWAIALDPTNEKAYRYWGDTLLQAGKPDEAREKDIDAVVASPYDRLVWSGLGNWAKKTGATLRRPNVPRPSAPQPVIEPPWAAYQSVRSHWQTVLFAQRFPQETTYRHTLAEESEALQAAAKAIADSKTPEDQLDPSLRDLAALANDNQIESFVLISAADNGIAKDYAAYRDQHWSQLHAYIAKYIAPIAQK